MPDRKVQLQSTADPALDDVTDADRAWFEAHPHRRFRLRPARVIELPAGTIVLPGLMTVVARLADGARLRSCVSVPQHKRRDTDRNCEALLPPDAKARLKWAREMIARGQEEMTGVADEHR